MHLAGTRLHLQGFLALCPLSTNLVSNKVICTKSSVLPSQVLENSDFADTDIPFDFNIPQRPYASEDLREEVSYECVRNNVQSQWCVLFPLPAPPVSPAPAPWCWSGARFMDVKGRR